MLILRCAVDRLVFHRDHWQPKLIILLLHITTRKKYITLQKSIPDSTKNRPPLCSYGYLKLFVCLGFCIVYIWSCLVDVVLLCCWGCEAIFVRKRPRDCGLQIAGTKGLISVDRRTSLLSYLQYPVPYQSRLQRIYRSQCPKGD